jgi:prepilin-type processing-associated H-X9-DG protein
VKDPTVFACPDDRRGLAEKTGTSYHWNVALNGQRIGSLNFMRLVDEQSHIPVIGDKEGFHPYQDNKVNILYADGHATQELNFVQDE